MQAKENLRRSAVTYGVLCACLLAAGVGAWIAARDTTSVQPPAQSTVRMTEATDYTPAQAPVQDIPLPETTETTEPPTIAETTEPPKRFTYPLGTFIVKDYSRGNLVYSATMEDWRVHNGIDFGDNRGQSVLAMGDGVVQTVESDPLWGVTVTIDHGSGITARYCGLEKDTAPAAGTSVEKGAVIGKLGEIPVESKEGPHLHLEVTVDGQPADPLEIIRTQ